MKKLILKIIKLFTKDDDKLGAFGTPFNNLQSNIKQPYKIVATDGSGDYNCNGTDDQTEINSAIDAVNTAGGGAVYLRAGTYTISSNVVIKSNIILRGEGEATVIKLEDEATLSSAGLIRAVDGASHFVLENFVVDGNKSNQTSGTNKYGFYCGESGDVSEYLILRNLHVKDCSGYGLDPHELTRYMLIEDCLVENNGDASNDFDGITTDYCEYSVIKNNIVKGNQRHGINIVTTSSNNVYIGNICEDNGDHGITINGSSDCVISNNVCIDNTQNGIYATSADDNNISDNYVSGNQQHGIKLYKSSYNVISNNKLKNNSQQTNNGYNEIILDDGSSIYSTYNIVSSNHIRCVETNKAKYGIREDAAGNDYNIITGNIATGAVTTNISSQGANSVSANNIAP
jgi:parallel beta-helix repeat protein